MTRILAVMIDTLRGDDRLGFRCQIIACIRIWEREVLGTRSNRDTNAVPPPEDVSDLGHANLIAFDLSWNK